MDKGEYVVESEGTYCETRSAEKKFFSIRKEIFDANVFTILF